MTRTPPRGARWLALLAAAAALPLYGAGGAVASAPPAPAGCNATSTVVTQPNATAIADLGTVTSTVTVAGVSGRLFDLDVTTAITHTWSADLDMTLTSPAGTVVTLTTDNGGGNNDVFNGTVWDDDANPAGAVPYNTNSGMATDHAYANVTTATPLVPEEAFGAFIGEDPNGTWTLTISDDESQDVGSLASWSIALTTTETPTSTAGGESQTTPAAVALADNGVTTSTIDVSGGQTIGDVNVVTNISHAAANNIDMTLTSPTGTVVTLSTDNGGGNDDVFAGTTWDDDANPLGAVPYATNNGVAGDHTYANLTVASPLVSEEGLAAFIGEDPNGTWTLTISDDTLGDLGTLNSWSLQFAKLACNADVSTTITDSPDPVVVGGDVTYDVTVTNNGPSDATDVTASLPLPASATFVSHSVSTGGSCTTPSVGATGTVDCSWSGGTASGSTRTVQVVATATAPGSIDATVTASSSTNDPAPGDNTATANTAVTAPDLVTTITDAPDPVTVGGTLTYDVSVTNAGDADAAGVSVNVPLPAEVTFTSATPSVDGSCTTPAVGASGTVDCTWSTDTAPAAVRTVQITGVATTVASATATATASTSTNEVDLADNAATATTSIVAVPVTPGTPPVSEDGKPCTITGTEGPDVLTGTDAVDVICGLGGEDTITSVGSGDFIDAGAGNDTVTVASGAGVVFGGPGNDRLTGGPEADKLTGGDGDDVLVGGRGNDRLAGGLGNDRASGGIGNDVVGGGSGNDRLDGGTGDDRVTAGAGADRAIGGAGKDIVVGGLGNDILDGGIGADRLQGDAGNDRLSGGLGNDRLSGGAGRDALTGGAGMDLVNGGSGIDTAFGSGDVFTAVEVLR